MKNLVKQMALLLLLAASARSAVVYTENFTAGANGWGDRDSGEMTVSHQASVGSPASAAMRGSFGASFLPQDDAFRIASGGNFIGDYSSYGDGLTRIGFDLFANNVVPSDVFVRLLSDTYGTFEYQLNLAALGTGAWTTFNVYLDWTYGWQGSNQADFNNALTSVNALEIQLTRNGNSAQQYYLDNITTYDTPLSAASAVPEPGSGLLFAGALLATTIRRLSLRKSLSADA